VREYKVNHFIQINEKKMSVFPIFMNLYQFFIGFLHKQTLF